MPLAAGRFEPPTGPDWGFWSRGWVFVLVMSLSRGWGGGGGAHISNQLGSGTGMDRLGFR